MRRLVSTVFAFTTLSASMAAQAPAPAATHPDLAGTWLLDTKNSAGMGVPQSMTLRITTDAKFVTFARVAATPVGEQRSTLMVKLDGSPTKNTVGTQGMTVDLNLTASWDGPTLVVKTASSIAGQPLNQTDRWTLAPDGKTLRMEMSVAGPQTGSAKLTFTKQ
jgi:hypothetical protein